MKILIYLFLINVNYCFSDSIDEPAKLLTKTYPKKVNPGMFLLNKGWPYKPRHTKKPHVLFTEAKQQIDNPQNQASLFPPLEKSFGLDIDPKRRVKKVLIDNSPGSRVKRAVEAKVAKPSTGAQKSIQAPSAGNRKQVNGTPAVGMRSMARSRVVNKRKRLARKGVIKRGKNGLRRGPRTFAGRNKRFQRQGPNLRGKLPKPAMREFVREKAMREGKRIMRNKNVNGVAKKPPGAADTINGRRLIAAKDAKIEDYPYVVSIQKDRRHWCAGAILNPRLVITTANCLWKGNRQSRMAIRAGSRYTDRGGQTADIQEIMKHPGWSIRSGPDNDVALVLLDKKLKFSHGIHSVDLPNRVMTPAFEDVWVTSWGSERRDGIYTVSTLQVYYSRLMDRKKCNNVTQRFGVPVSSNFICLAQSGHRAPCTRDTGAPAVSDGVLWGLASWGIRKLCGTERYPAMFSYIASESNMDFIMNATRFLMAEERNYPFLDKGIEGFGPVFKPLHDAADK